MGEAKLAEAKRKTLALVAEIDEAELTVRIAEIATGTKRPLGMTPQQALANMEAAARGNPHMTHAVQSFGKMARAACMYFGECIAQGTQPS